MVYEPAGGKEREGGRMAGREAGREGGRLVGREAVPSRTCATLGTLGRGSASAPSSAAPGLPIPLRYIPASAVALRRDGDRVSGRGGASARFS